MARKSPDKKKSRVVKMRVTEDDYNQIKSNQEIYGYGTLTRYLTAAGVGKIEGFKPAGIKVSKKLTVEEAMEAFVHKVSGVVERYNFIYDSMSNLIPQLSDIRERRQYLIQMARLNQEVKKLVKVFKEVKSYHESAPGMCEETKMNTVEIEIEEIE